MRRSALAALLFALLPGAAARAAPAWKQAPGADKDGGKGIGFNVDVDWAGYLETARAFLGNNWEYFGVLFVVLTLYLFVRGSKRKTARLADEDEAFFDDDPGEDVRFR